MIISKNINKLSLIITYWLWFLHIILSSWYNRIFKGFFKTIFLSPPISLLCWLPKVLTCRFLTEVERTRTQWPAGSENMTQTSIEYKYIPPGGMTKFFFFYTWKVKENRGKVRFLKKIYIPDCENKRFGPEMPATQNFRMRARCNISITDITANLHTR